MKIFLQATKKNRLRSIKTKHFFSQYNSLRTTVVSPLKYNKNKEISSKVLYFCARQITSSNFRKTYDVKKEDTRKIEDIEQERKLHYQSPVKPREYDDEAIYEPGQGHLDNYEGGLQWTVKTLDGENITIQGRKDHDSVVEFNRQAKAALREGNMAKGLALLQVAKDLIETLEGEKHIKSLEARIDVGSIYANLGFLVEAEVELIESIRLLQEHHYENPLRLRAMRELGMLYRKQNKFEESVKVLEGALRAVENVSGLDPTGEGVALIHNALARNAITFENLDKGEEHAKKAVSKLREIKGEHHYDTLASELTLGKVYALKKDRLSAEYRFFNICKHGVGDIVAEALTELGLMYHNEKEFKRARQFYEEAKIVLTKLHGDGYWEVGSLFTNIGILYFEEKKFNEAEFQFLKAIDIFGDKPEQLLRRLITVNSLTQLYIEQKEWGKALPRAQEATTLTRRIFQKDSELIKAAEDMESFVLQNKNPNPS
eukprot:TRINITY_DN5701_c0_g1_i1.p1 TRINITY_DN5701_c0_g1~~TRINITY_DN5701_c0_g1_i1.p1  ORF type:complete len:487 (+),score=96.90 TRINITY_DN5701_c0_g1_i1:50-1510(+)